MRARQLGLFAMVAIGLLNFTILMILVTTTRSTTDYPPRDRGDYVTIGTRSNDLADLAIATGVPVVNAIDAPLNKTESDHTRAAESRAPNVRDASVPKGTEKETFQSLRQNWSFNATAADEFRSLLDKNCNTSQTFLTTQDNVRPYGILQYEAEKKSKLNITPEVYNRFLQKMPYHEKPFKKCSIVGNSGFLLNSQCGQSIDAADFVIRFNLATVHNFSEDVGSKTDLMTCNPTLLQRTYKILQQNESQRFVDHMMSEYPKASLYIPAFTYRFCTKYSFKAQDILQPENIDVVFPHPRHILSVKNFWKKRIKERRITSGLLLFTGAMSFCDEVHLYGFWPFPEDPDGNPLYYHYFDKSAVMLPPQKLQKLHHNMPEEYKMYIDLHRKGILRLHVGKCNAS